MLSKKLSRIPLIFIVDAEEERDDHKAEGDHVEACFKETIRHSSNQRYFEILIHNLVHSKVKFFSFLKAPIVLAPETISPIVWRIGERVVF